MEIDFPCRLTVYFHPGSWESLQIDSQEQLDKWTGALRNRKYNYAISSTTTDPSYQQTNLKLLEHTGTKYLRKRDVGWLSYLSRHIWSTHKKTMGYRPKVDERKTEDCKENQ